MNIIVTFLRNLVGCVIVFFDLITRGRRVKREPQAQEAVAADTASLSLYQFFACPFCIKTRRKIYQLNLPIAKRSISKGSPYRDELLEHGGKVQAPCLKIESEDGVTWMYESSEIIAYLQTRYAN